MDITLERTWERDEIRDDLETALAIVEELQPPEDLRGATFNIAVQLVTQRAMRQQVNGIHLAPGNLPLP